MDAWGQHRETWGRPAATRGALLVLLAYLWHPRPSDTTDEGADEIAAVDQFLESQLRDAAIPDAPVVNGEQYVVPVIRPSC